MYSEADSLDSEPLTGANEYVLIKKEDNDPETDLSTLPTPQPLKSENMIGAKGNS